jgi:hypothetical protein
MPPAEFADLWSEDRSLQNVAMRSVFAATDQPVDWAYAVWDELLAQLSHPDNHNRAIAAQVLCNLAKSDPERRLLGDFDSLFAVTRDPRFVTARHCLQSMWKVGAAGLAQQALLVRALQGRFEDCTGHKNCTLIRYDIIESLRKLYDEAGDDEIRRVALALIASEDDPKVHKKYARLWKDV